MRHYAKFTTEQGKVIEIDVTIEVANHLTGEILVAGRASPDEAVIIPAQWVGSNHPVLALREESEYRRSVKRGVAC